MKVLKNRYIRRFLRIIFSNLGLTFLVTSYLIAGAFLFQWLEEDVEKSRKRLIYDAAMYVQDQRYEIQGNVLNLLESCKNSNSSYCQDEVAVNMMLRWIRKYEQSIVGRKNDTDGKYKGQQAVNNTDVITDWSVPSGILFTASILSTIGYGIVTPKSELGQLVVILYAVLAIPLMSMFLINVGSSLGWGMRWFYQKVSCAKSRSNTDEPKGRWARRIAPAPDSEESKEKHVQVSEYQIPDVPLIVVAVVGVVYITVGMLLFHATEKWTWIQALYFTFVTLSTIGFGDFVPSSDADSLLDQMRMVMTVVYIFIGLAVFAMCISLVMSVLKTYREKMNKVMGKWKKN